MVTHDQQTEFFPSAPAELIDALAPDWAERTYQWIMAEIAAGRTVQVSTYGRVVPWTPQTVAAFRKLGVEPFKVDLLGELRMFEGWRMAAGGKRARYVCLVNTVGIRTF